MAPPFASTRSAFAGRPPASRHAQFREKLNTRSRPLVLVYVEAILCSPNDTYIIVEAVYVVLTTNRVGPTMRKVVRHVARTCEVQDVLYDGQKLTSMPGGWQLLMDAVGLAELTTRPTGATQMTLAYAGFENLVRLLPTELSVPALPQGMFREVRLPQAGLFRYGRDPIPEVRLFNNPAIPFVSAGGDAPPTAMGIYYGATRRLEPVPRAEQVRALRQLGL